MKQGRDMKIAQGVYWGLLIAAGLFLILCFFFRYALPVPAVAAGRNGKPFILRQGADEVSSDGTIVYSIPWQEVRAHGNSFFFHARHANVTVSADGQVLYSVEAKKSLLGTTTGSFWVSAYIPDETEAVEVRLFPLYPEVAGDRPVFLIGGLEATYRYLLLSSLPTMIVSLIDILIGIYMIIYYLMQRTKSLSVRPAIYIGICSLIVGFWTCFETDGVELITFNHVAASAVSLVTLMLLPCPFVFYIRETLFPEDKVLWRILAGYGIVEPIVCILLSFTGVRDLRQTLPFSQLSIVLSILYMLVAVVSRVWRGHRDFATIMHIVGLIVMGGSGFFDIAVFNTKSAVHADHLSMGDFTAYILIASFLSMSESAKEIREGHMAAYYKNLVMMEPLTGIGSRMAYMKEADGLKEGEAFGVVSMDLNGLKEVNDSFGHLEGDRYICRAAELISEVFAKYGNCYRTGGDEFAVILKDENVEKADDLLARFRTVLDGYDLSEQKDTKGHLTVAVGFAKFEPDTDRNFDDVTRRADAEMYEHKRQMKAER